MFGKIKNFKNKLGKWFWVILVIAAIVIWRVFASSNTSVKVQMTQVSQGDLVQTISTSGTIMADQYSQLTFPAGGKVVGVFVKSGDKVKKGQSIAELDTVPLNAAYQEALNNYRNTQAAVDFEHDQDKNYGSAETFAEKATRTEAEVANDNAYNAMLAAQDNLANAVITAPFAGVIDTVNPSSPGMQVLPGAADYIIINPDTVYMDAEVEETDLPNVAVGQTVNIALDAYPDQTFTGIVTNIGLVAFTSSTGGNAYHVRISLPQNDSLRFKVGMQGDTNIVYNTISNAVKVSTTALVSENDKNYVWAIENGRAKKVEVQIGGASDTETEITSGLISGQSVIDNPSGNLVNGAKVSS